MKKSKRTITQLGAALMLALSVAFVAPVAAHADSVRGGTATTADRCWQLRNEGIWILQSQGYTVTSAPKCVFLNATGMWHFTLQYVEMKNAR